MYALAINGSPREGGNTERMLSAALGPLRDAGWRTELVQVGGRPMRGCIACFQCHKNKDKRCVLTEDAFNEVFARMLEADAIIIGSPTYFADVTAETKAVLDRAGFVAMGNGRAFAGKIGAAVVVARRGGAIHVFDTINHMYYINRMVIPGSRYWNIGYGMGPGDVDKDEEAIKNMHHLGQMIAWLGEAMAARMATFPRGGEA